MRHAEAEQLLAAGAVLGDLAADEQAEYDAHRATCGACRSLELELDHVLADLALVVPERLPPADLLHGIRIAIAAEAVAPAAYRSLESAVSAPGAPAPAAPVLDPLPAALVLSPVPAALVRPSASATTPSQNVVKLDRAAARRPQRLMVAGLGLAAVLGIVAVGLGARSMTLQRDLEAASAQVTQLETALAGAGTAMTVAMNPSHLTVPLHAEAVAPAAQAAVMYVPGSTSSWIVAEDLPATPAGQGYQLWYADAAGVHGLQTIAFDGNGPFVAPIDADLAQAAAVMITLEQAGGATSEPGPQVVFGEL